MNLPLFPFYLSAPTSPLNSWWLQYIFPYSLPSAITQLSTPDSQLPRSAPHWQPTDITNFLYIFRNILHTYTFLPTFFLKHMHTYKRYLPIYSILMFVHLAMHLGDCYMSVKYLRILFQDYRISSAWTEHNVFSWSLLMTTWVAPIHLLSQTLLPCAWDTLPMWERVYGVNSKEHN